MILMGNIDKQGNISTTPNEVIEAHDFDKKYMYEYSFLMTYEKCQHW